MDASALDSAIDRLEYLLTSDIMPEDYSLEDLVELTETPPTIATAESKGQVDFAAGLGALIAEALPIFAETQENEQLRSGEFSLAHQELFSRFTALLEGELERELAQERLTVKDFHQALRCALESDDPEQRTTRAAAKELLELLDETCSFQRWADAMKRRSRDWFYFAKGSDEQHCGK